MFCNFGHPTEFNEKQGRHICPVCEKKRKAAQRPAQPATASPRQRPVTGRLTGLGVAVPVEESRAKEVVDDLPANEPLPEVTTEEVTTEEVATEEVATEKAATEKAPSKSAPFPTASAETTAAVKRHFRNATQPKLALQPGRQTTKVARKEESIQNGSYNLLLSKGYRVFVNTVKMNRILVRCDCGRQWWQSPNYKTHQSPGIPDLHFFNPRWFHPLLPATPWMPLEQKGTTTQLSVEQKELFQGGHITVARDPDTSLQTAQQADRFFQRIYDLEHLAEKLHDWHTRNPEALPAELVERLQSVPPLNWSREATKSVRKKKLKSVVSNN